MSWPEPRNIEELEAGVDVLLGLDIGMCITAFKRGNKLYCNWSGQEIKTGVDWWCKLPYDVERD